jgi:uracil phosphoribosyltransferase
MTDSPAAVPAVTILREYPQVTLVKQTAQVTLLHTVIRDAQTSRQDFVFYADRLIRLIVEDGLAHLPVAKKDVITPTGARYEGIMPAAGICGVSIMRAGEVMETALRDTCRGARIGKILIQRNEDTAEPDDRFSYSKVPGDINERWVFLMDPMLATGGSAIRAVNILLSQYKVKEERIIFLNVVSCPEGLAAFCTKFPKIRVVTSAIDDNLNEKKYIMPGLGDFGDRYFGTTH